MQHLKGNFVDLCWQFKYINTHDVIDGLILVIFINNTIDMQ